MDLGPPTLVGGHCWNCWRWANTGIAGASAQPRVDWPFLDATPRKEFFKLLLLTAQRSLSIPSVQPASFWATLPAKAPTFLFFTKCSFTRWLRPKQIAK